MGFGAREVRDWNGPIANIVNQTPKDHVHAHSMGGRCQT